MESTSRVDTGSVITIRGIVGLRGGRFPDKGIDVIARILVEKILPYFIDKKAECPKIVVVDEVTGETIILNNYLSQSTREITELPVENNVITLDANGVTEEFSVRVFKFYSPRSARSKISLVAHRREVTDVTIQTYVPESTDEFFESAKEGEAARNFIVKAYVFGDYLDRNVSFERGAFNFQKDQDLIYGISQSQLERCAAEIAREAVGQEVSDRRARKLDRIRAYIDNDAPWHRTIGKEADFSSLPMNPSPHDIELHLQAAKFDIERRARDDVRRILDDTSGELNARVVDVVNSISQTSKNDLIHYVSLRKCVLDLLSKSLESDDLGKYKSEGNVHDIIMPRRTNSDTGKYEQHNLWILDERLNFAGYVSSELPFEGKTGDRADVVFFGNRIAFRGNNEPSNPIIIFEFKKPQRHDFVNPSSDEDPVQQIIRYVNDIRDGKYKTPGGREILVTDNTPFYGYVVCDLPQKTRRWLERDKNFTEMPDGLGYFQWYGNIRLYVEVLSWTKIHKDAEMRNKIFFHKLGINAPEY